MNLSSTRLQSKTIIKGEQHFAVQESDLSFAVPWVEESDLSFTVPWVTSSLLTQGRQSSSFYCPFLTCEAVFLVD